MNRRPADHATPADAERPDERAAIAGTAPAHGGLLEEELAALGVPGGEVIDASVNVNPYGPCAAVRGAIAQAAVDRYPEPRASGARRALAEWMRVAPTRVVVGNGAVDLLWALARALLSPTARLGVVEPAFSEMTAAARRLGAPVVEHRLRATDGFAVDVDALDAFVAEARPRVLYVASPSNPAGRCTPLPALAQLAARHPETRFVVDISFLSMSAGHAEADTVGALSDRIVWIRSLTKDHALPGLRVGFGIAPVDVAAAIEAQRPPWSVNALAQAAAIAVATPGARAFIEESRERWLKDRARLEAALAPLGLRLHRSDATFTLADLGADADATALRRSLLVRHRVLVRDATSFGLARHVRIAARPEREVERIAAALREELVR